LSDNNNVPYQEEVTRGELRHALRGYSAMGYPPAGYVPASNGMVTIIIMAPPATAIPDWRTGAFAPSAPSPRRTWPALDWRMWVQMVCMVVILGGIGYGAWAMFVPAASRPAVTAQTGGMRLDPATGHMAEPTAAEGALSFLAGLLPKAAPPAAQKADQEKAGWKWPPANPVGEAIDGATQAVLWLVYAVIALGVLWGVSFVVGIAGKFKGGK
jgi:hypothetical protein